MLLVLQTQKMGKWRTKLWNRTPKWTIKTVLIKIDKEKYKNRKQCDVQQYAKDKIDGKKKDEASKQLEVIEKKSNKRKETRTMQRKWQQMA